MKALEERLNLVHRGEAPVLEMSVESILQLVIGFEGRRCQFEVARAWLREDKRDCTLGEFQSAYRHVRDRNGWKYINLRWQRNKADEKEDEENALGLI